MIVNFTNYKTGSAVSVRLEDIASSEVMNMIGTKGEHQITTLVTKQGEKYTVEGDLGIFKMSESDRYASSISDCF